MGVRVRVRVRVGVSVAVEVRVRVSLERSYINRGVHSPYNRRVRFRIRSFGNRIRIVNTRLFQQTTTTARE